MGAFKILMWKHYTVRKRKAFQTFMECFCPIVIVMVIFLLKDSMRKKHSKLSEDSVRLSDPVMKMPPILIRPDSDATQKLMANSFYTTDSQKAWDKTRKSDDNLNANLESMNAIAVEFDNMTESSIPDRLSYTIQMMPALSNMPMLRTYNNFESFSQPLLKLQWAIDSSFLRLKSRKGLSIQNVSFEALSETPSMRAVNLEYVNSVFLLLPYTVFLGPLLPFIFLMTRLLEERSSGIQELVKMVGVTPAMLGFSQYLNSLPPCILFAVVSTIFMKHGGEDAMVPATTPSIILIALFLHYNTIIALAFASSFLTSDAQYTVSVSMFVYIGMWVPVMMLHHEANTHTKLFFKGLLPHCPVYWFLSEMHNAEVYYGAFGINYTNWNEHWDVYKGNDQNGTVKAALLMMMLQIVLMYILTWYLERVRPGKYGIASPWNFPCQKDYWSQRRNIPDKAEETSSHDPEYQKYFEDPPTDMDPGIKISHVSKIFGSGAKQFQALNNVSLDIYKGEITVLLGHNGAGKTTLISIITGMIMPTSGKIYVNGMDTVTQQEEVRKHLGLCPQHNLFFPDLTVMEHFLFFSMIKGGSFHEAEESAHVLMAHLNLTDKAHRKTSELSGGMLRRLQLGCALCGNASVLILDEPTSGLDVEARRELWDMLLALRGDRTLVLTTHFMEEADVLGDRLAALHAGRLRSHATPMFLKRAVGSGFRLTITTFSEPDVSKITQCVNSSVSGAILANQTKNTLIYILPPGANLPAMFQNIERRKAELDIEYLSIGITTLEEVFLELCTDVDKDDKLADDDETKKPVVYHYVYGCTRLCRQFCALLRRQWDYTMSRKSAYIILQIIMPFVMCMSLTDLFNNKDLAAFSQLQDISLDMYSDEVPKMAMYRIKGNATRRRNGISQIKEFFPDFVFKPFDDVHNCRCKHPDKNQLKNFVVGIDINDTSAKVLYRPSIKHSPAVGLNLLSNVLAAQRMRAADKKTITTKISNRIYLRSNSSKNATMPKLHIPKTKMNCALFAIFNIFMLMATAINDVALPCRERLTVARHTHIMAGCPPYLYWLATFAYHMLGFLMFSLPATMCAAAFMDQDKTIDDSATLKAYAVAIVLSGMDFYAFAYFISYHFNERGASMLLITLTIVFGFLSPILMMALEDLKSKPTDPEPLFNQFMSVAGAILPAHMFTDVVIKMTDTSRFNSFCMHNFPLCFNLTGMIGFDKDKCCKEGSKDKGPYDHFAFSKYAMGWPLIIIAVQFVVFAMFVLLLEYKYCNRWWNAIGKMRSTQYPPKQFNSPQVAEEKQYIDQLSKTPKEKIKESMYLHNAWKTYYRMCGKPTFALRDANFSVNKGECFGILGVNGAGKTTTFKLIAYEEAANRGTSYVNGHYLSKSPTQYMSNLGYCPQFCGLDAFRPGADNLRMLLIMRGYNDAVVKRETAIWLAVVGMTRAGHRPVADYSGGMVRRLATAASLCAGSPVTLLDEPTAGVDTAARRLVWVALRRGMLNDRSIVLTSHSMDEMEMLCRRVTILGNGEMCVLGTPAALRDEHAPGNGIVLKLRVGVVQSPIGPQRVQELKDAIERSFNCSLKDEHLTSLQYRINEQLEYSNMFQRMESIEAQFSDLLEDYSVSDTTLEDVFLKFAHK